MSLRDRMDPAYHPRTSGEIERDARRDAEDESFREAAQYPYIGDDGPVFFERKPEVRRRGDGAGAFVACWVWVDGTEYRDEEGREPYTPNED